MYGTELLIERKKRRDELKANYLGAARAVGYYDVAEMLAHVGPAATYSFDRVVTASVIAVGLVRMGVPIEQVCAAYNLDPDEVGSWNVHQVILTDAQRAEIEAQVVQLVPDTGEPQRFVKATHKVGTLTTDRGAGDPQPAGTSAEGSAPAQFGRK
jgi:hypothetical protein